MKNGDEAVNCDQIVAALKEARSDEDVLSLLEDFIDHCKVTDDARIVLGRLARSRNPEVATWSLYALVETGGLDGYENQVLVAMVLAALDDVDAIYTSLKLLRRMRDRGSDSAREILETLRQHSDLKWG